MPGSRRGTFSPAADDAAPRAGSKRWAYQGRTPYVGGVAVEWTIGTVLWWMVVLFYWFAFIWMFIVVFGDILRRDMSGWAKAGWIVLILLLPVVGRLAAAARTSRTAGSSAGWRSTGRSGS
jgi:hypothetical protein